MRGVRDKYLDLLLTGGSGVTPTAAATPAPAAWTPGHRLSPHTTAHWAARPPPPRPAWSSPVSPGPTEGDVRLAEIAAGLVAAGGVEHRQSDTIRRLATQLERSERKLRSLESRKRRIRSSPLVETEMNPMPRTAAKNDARRHIRFTPGKERQDGGRRVCSSSPQKPNREVYEELERLRREREEWVNGKRRSEAEARRVSRMLADIKKNTARMLAEREDHLNVIARLQGEVRHLKQRTPMRVVSEFPPATRISSRRDASPVPLFNRRESLENIPNMFEDVRESSPASVRDHSFGKAGDNGYASASSGGQDHKRQSAEDHEPAVRQPSERERELHEELRLVLEENAKLSQRIPELEAVCFDLSAQLHHAKTATENENAAKADQRISGTSESIANELGHLVEELEILEGVSDAINFGMTPSEADQLEETMTNLHLTTDDTDDGVAHGKGSKTSSPAEIVQSIVTRLVQIRARLSFRYGQWLKAVGDDDLTSIGTEATANTGIGGNNSLKGSTKSVDETMDTQVIDRIIGLE